MSERLQALMKAFEGADASVRVIVEPLFEEMAFIEGQLAELKKYPMVRFNPNNPNLQKITPSGRMYKDLLSQQKDLVRLVCSYITKAHEGGGESPLREYMAGLD